MNAINPSLLGWAQTLLATWKECETSTCTKQSKRSDLRQAVKLMARYCQSVEFLLLCEEVNQCKAYNPTHDRVGFLIGCLNLEGLKVVMSGHKYVSIELAVPAVETPVVLEPVAAVVVDAPVVPTPETAPVLDVIIRPRTAAETAEDAASLVAGLTEVISEGYNASAAVVALSRLNELLGKLPVIDKLIYDLRKLNGNNKAKASELMGLVLESVHPVEPETAVVSSPAVEPAVEAVAAPTQQPKPMPTTATTAIQDQVPMTKQMTKPAQPAVEPAPDHKGQQVGYIRVSSVGQNTDRQLLGVELDKVFEEKLSAKTIDRPELTAALSYVRTGDTLHIHSLDRVCRSGAGDAVKLVEELTSRGVGVKFHKEGMEFYGNMSAAQRGVLSILASVAEMERGMIKERQLEGIAAAKAKGKAFGRPRASTGDDSIMALLAEGLKMPQIVTRLGISRASAYRLLKKEQDAVEASAAPTGTK